MKEYWYPAQASSQLRYKPLAVEILDRRLALFRDSLRKAHALLDRCCHRGMPLSKGKLAGDLLACAYHGWEFAGDGRCAKIPSQRGDQPIPQSHRVPGFPTAEQDGYVWVWMGAGKPAAVPRIPEISSGRWIQGSREIACDFVRALEITFDASHVYVLHPSHPATLMAKQNGMAEYESELRLTESGCVWFSPATKSAAEPIPRSAFAIEFELPGRFRFSSGNVGSMYFHAIPIGERRCRIDWAISDWNPAASEPGVRWVGGDSAIIGEDAFALEAVQPAYDAEGEAFEKSVAADLPTLTLRRIVRAAQNGKWNPKKAALPSRRTFKSMGAVFPKDGWQPPAGSEEPKDARAAA